MLERRAKAFELRQRGATFQAIADELEYASKQAAWYDVQAALRDARDLYEDDLAALRSFELERLDMLSRTAWEHADAGDIKALDVLLRIADRRSKLLGLDQPIKHEITDDAIEREVRRLEAIIADAEAGESDGDD